MGAGLFAVIQITVQVQWVCKPILTRLPIFVFPLTTYKIWYSTNLWLCSCWDFMPKHRNSWCCYCDIIITKAKTYLTDYWLLILGFVRSSSWCYWFYNRRGGYHPTFKNLPSESTSHEHNGKSSIKKETKTKNQWMQEIKWNPSIKRI